jgi:hypothetical protein
MSRRLPTIDTMSEPMQPSRVEKNPNMLVDRARPMPGVGHPWRDRVLVPRVTS